MSAPINIPSAKAVKTVAVNGGNLFRLALDNLGDPLQWTRLAGANRLIDPFLPPNSPLILTIPPINPAFSNSGVLSPNGGPIFGMSAGDVLSSAPINTSIPTISGIVQVGQILTATTGIWANSPLTFAYQWRRAGTVITGAQSQIYVPVAADIGNALTVSVVAVNSLGTGIPSTSAATGQVVDTLPTINIPAAIVGVPHVGTPITATDATWNNSVNSRAYQWQSAGVNASGPGAITLTYTPVIGDVGNTLTIIVTATNSAGSASSTSASSAAVLGATGGILDFSQTLDSSLITVIAA
jgi:hypothetical protein